MSYIYSTSIDTDVVNKIYNYALLGGSLKHLYSTQQQ